MAHGSPEKFPAQPTYFVVAAVQGGKRALTQKDFLFQQEAYCLVRKGLETVPDFGEFLFEIISVR